MLAVNIIILFFSFRNVFYEFFSGEARGDDDRGADVWEDPGSEHPG